MTDDVKALRDDFEKFVKKATREIEAQAKAIRKLQKEVEDLQGERKKLTTYINNLMKKAETMIKQNYASLRRTQVIDRQKLTEIEADVDRILRQKK